MSQRRLPYRPGLEAFEDRICLSSTTVLPISAFLDQQGHDSVFTPPVRDQNAWTNSAFDPGTGNPNRLLLVDYTGQAAKFLLAHKINLFTSVTGSVTETPIGSSGLMEVTVNLEARNALTWVIDTTGIDYSQLDAVNRAPLELGYRAQELVDNPNLIPALSNVQMQVTWQEQLGANLPDMARLNENYALFAPPGFSYERFNFQSSGTGTLRADTTVGLPGQTAIVYTSQVADLTNPGLPGTLGDGFFQEPIDIIPVGSVSTQVASPNVPPSGKGQSIPAAKGQSTSRVATVSVPAKVAYLNGTLFVNDMSDGNDTVLVTPAANGGATLTSNLGNGTFAGVTSVVVSLGGGRNSVQIGDLAGARVNVTALDGNNIITIGNTAKLVVHVGGGSNRITTGNSSPAAQFIGVGGNGYNRINVSNTNAAVILVAGNGYNQISAAGTGDFIEVMGNGSNTIKDTGTGDLVWLGGDGNNDIDNQGRNSFTRILAGTGRNRIQGPH